MGEDKVEKNVWDFIVKCSKEIGDFETENFHQNIWYRCIEGEMKSPIEQILYCAIKTIARLNFVDEFGGSAIKTKNNQWLIEGLDIIYQKKIDKYRCDFFISYGTYLVNGKQKLYKELIVECDSQQFHERNEQERRYEKQRDRYLLLKGYKIFHYTGSEIVKRPLQIAAEIIAYLTETDIENLQLDHRIE